MLFGVRWSGWMVWMDFLELELVCLVGRYTVYCVQDSPQLFGYCVFRWGEEKEYEEFRCKCWSYTSTVPTDPRFITMPGRRAMGLSFFKGGALPIWEGRYLLTDPRKVGAVTSNGRKTTKLEDVRINACPVPSRAIPRLVAVESFLLPSKTMHLDFDFDFFPCCTYTQQSFSFECAPSFCRHRQEQPHHSYLSSRQHRFRCQPRTVSAFDGRELIYTHTQYESTAVIGTLFNMDLPNQRHLHDTRAYSIHRCLRFFDALNR